MIHYRADFGYRNEIEYMSFPVIKETLKGNWFNVWDKKKFVLKKGRKKYLYPTKELAIEALHCRKLRYHKILLSRINVVKEQLNLLDTLKSQRKTK